MSDESVSDRCVICGQARALPDGNGGIIWAKTSGTPLDCDHETLDGRS